MSPIPVGFCQCGCGARTKLARQSSTEKGWVKGQPVQYAKGHRARRDCYLNCHTVDPETGCWRWTLRRDRDGYGLLTFLPRVGGIARTLKAHRYYYELLVGPIPEGLQIDHLCRNRACVNPAHLEPVTPGENVRRGSLTRLTADAVATIRASSEAATVVAARYGVTAGYVTNLRCGIGWETP